MSGKDALFKDPYLVALYDEANTGRNDFTYYQSSLPDVPLHILDLGCGTGFFARSLAQMGHKVVGIDPATEMMAYARSRPNAETVTWIDGTVMDIPVDQTFDVVFMTGHAFQCLLSDTDILDVFRTVKQRLSPGGKFLFESRNPDAKAWLNWTPDKETTFERDGIPMKTIHQVLAVEGQMVSCRESYQNLRTGEIARSESTLRFSSEGDIIDLAMVADLTPKILARDWTGAMTGPELIFELTRR